MTLCSFGIHQWTKWTYKVINKIDYGYAWKPHAGIEVTEERQDRHCLRCGLIQIKDTRCY